MRIDWWTDGDWGVHIMGSRSTTSWAFVPPRKTRPEIGLVDGGIEPADSHPLFVASAMSSCHTQMESPALAATRNPARGATVASSYHTGSRHPGCFSREAVDERRAAHAIAGNERR